MPDEKTLRLYVRAMEMRAASANDRDEKILAFVLRNRWALGLMDSALAFGSNTAALRQKLLVMTAILETRPAYAEHYLPRNRSAFYFFAAGWFAFRAVLKMIAGKFILLFVR
jgi:hypothetical protein